MPSATPDSPFGHRRGDTGRGAVVGLAQVALEAAHALVGVGLRPVQGLRHARLQLVDIDRIGAGSTGGNVADRGRAAAGAAEGDAVEVGGTVDRGVVADGALLRGLQLANVYCIGGLRAVSHVDHLALGTGGTDRHRVRPVRHRTRTQCHRVVGLCLRTVAQRSRIGTGSSRACATGGRVGTTGGRVGQVVGVVGAEAAGHVGDVLDLLVAGRRWSHRGRRSHRQRG
ncbi:hypothetical protein G6F35_014414 [Rhizopus arrhizus]|nr:hypothetical protein G6F35_014414 [Rhizopus arrhizus]